MTFAGQTHIVLMFEVIQIFFEMYNYNQISPNYLRIISGHHYISRLTERHKKQPDKPWLRRKNWLCIRR